MSEQTAISWCDSTFNPWIGCTKVSPACDHCYAARQDAFRKWTPEGWGGPRRRTSDALWEKPGRWNAQEFVECASCGYRCELRHFHAVDGPADWTMCPACSGADWHGARRRVFCASLADVFDNQVPDEWREDLFELIRTTPNLDWLLLTKRPQNIVRMVRAHGAIAGNGTRYLPDNVRLGTTCEDQQRADINIPALLRTRAELGARSLFISIEPMLGPVDLTVDGLVCSTACPWCADHGADPDTGAVEHCRRCEWTGKSDEWGIDWVICGGESGPQARPMHPDWVRSLRDQCAAASVPFHFKQWGEWAADPDDDRGAICKGITSAGEVLHNNADFNAHAGDAELMFRVGTKHAGRLLDGIEHNGVPT